MTLNPQDATPDFPAPAATWPGSAQNPNSGNSYSAEQIEAWRGNFIELIIEQVVLVVTGVFIPGGAGGALGQLAEWAESVPILGDIVGALTGKSGGGLDDLLGNLLPGLFGVVPVGTVADVQPNRLREHLFTAGSLPASSDWTVDLAASRSSDGSGAAKVVADGALHALRSGSNPTDVIAVTAGQTINAKIYVRHQGYTGSGAAVLLQAVPYTNGVAGDPAPFTVKQTTGPGVEADVPATFTPAGPDLAWPGYELSGTYVVPAGVTGIQERIVVTRAATAGTFWFDDPETVQTGQLQQEWIDGLPSSLESLIGRWQLLIDTIFNKLTGGSGIGNTLEQLAAALGLIPSENVTGVGGPSDIGSSVINFFTHLLGGLVGTPPAGSTPPSPSDGFNIAQIISQRASQGANAWEVLGVRNNSPVDAGLLPSSEANYNLTIVNTDLAATSAASVIGIMRVQRSAPLGVVSWRGSGTSGLSAFYVNIWKINSTSGDWSLVHHSPNIVADLDPSTSPVPWQFYFLASPLARVAGEDYAYELVPVGGTHTVRGFSTADNVPDHPYAQVVALAATRNNTSPNSPPSSIAKASVVRSNNIPWIETAIDTGNTSDQRDPVTVYLTESTSVPIPSWAGYVDVIALGAGGGARSGFIGAYGEAGKPGGFAAATWQRGVDFTGSGTQVVFTRGAAGSAGGSSGGAGGASTLAITGHTVTAAGGAGGTDLKPLAAQIGRGPGTFDYGGEKYVGGGDQKTTGAGGVAPGGAGNGGNAFGLQGGGAGAPGAGWVRFRPAADTGGVPELDTTPPTAPTLTITASTLSSLTVTATGATD